MTMTRIEKKIRSDGGIPLQSMTAMTSRLREQKEGFYSWIGMIFISLYKMADCS